MHTVLRNFMNTARRRLLVYAVEMVKRARAFANGVALLDRFCDVGFGQQHGIAQGAAAGELRVRVEATSFR